MSGTGSDIIMKDSEITEVLNTARGFVYNVGKITLFAIFLVIGFYWQLRETPPIDIECRNSLLYKGKVIRVINKSESKHLSCCLRVRSRLNDSEKSYYFTIEPDDYEEVGVLEMGWNFCSGEKGEVEVEGYFFDKEFVIP